MSLSLLDAVPSCANSPTMHECYASSNQRPLAIPHSPTSAQGAPSAAPADRPATAQQQVRRPPSHPALRGQPQHQHQQLLGWRESGHPCPPAGRALNHRAQPLTSPVWRALCLGRLLRLWHAGYGAAAPAAPRPSAAPAHAAMQPNTEQRLNGAGYYPGRLWEVPYFLALAHSAAQA